MTGAGRRHGSASRGDALPNVVIIGTMKCGTTALHRALGRHPQVAASAPKELNFFYGPERVAPGANASWVQGNRWRGTAWYARHFPADAPIRVEASPGYTSPDHPGVADRMAELIPGARLIFLVRDPLDRMVSQYRHHVRDGTERRPLAEALADPDSQYLSRSRYFRRLSPFLDRFPRNRILIVAQEDLRADPDRTLRRVCAFAGADAARWPETPSQGRVARVRPMRPGGTLRAFVAAELRDDVARLRHVADGPLPIWSV